jgi:hypothetical protein
LILSQLSDIIQEKYACNPVRNYQHEKQKTEELKAAEKEKAPHIASIPAAGRCFR